MLPFTKNQEAVFLAVSIVGLLVPNGVFLYVAATNPSAVQAALANPASVVFVAEAFGLTGLFAWLVQRSGMTKPGWLAFVVLTLLGSLAFSVPLFLALASRRARSCGSV